MHSGHYLPSLDALSNEQSNLSTQQDYTSKMIKEVKQLKKKHFYKIKDFNTFTNNSFRKKTSNNKSTLHKHLFDLTTFHMNALRDNIHSKSNNGKVIDAHTSTRIKLILEQKNKTLDQFTTNSDNVTFSSNNSKKFPQSSTLTQTISSKKYNDRYSKSLPKYNEHHYYMNTTTNMNTDSRNDKKYCITSYSHHQENCKSLNYYFGVYATHRNETIYDFMEKSRNIRIKKIMNHVIKDSYSKYKNDRINNMDLVRADIYNFSTGYDYLKKYAETSDEYFIYLYKEIENQLHKLKKYKEKRINLMNEAHKINQRLNRIQVRFNSNFNNKFFLMCVKNETIQPHLFCEPDKNEYEQDMQKLHFLMNIGSIEFTNPIKAEENEYLLEKEMVMFNTQNKEQPQYFNSSEHFIRNLNKISTRVTLLMNDYNESQIVLKKLRNELEQAKMEVKYDEKNNLFWELEIDDKEKKLMEAKTKHAALMTYYENLPKTKDLQIEKLLNVISKHYNEIKQKANFVIVNENSINGRKRRECYDNSKHAIAIEKMKYIEGVVNGLVNLNSKWKKENEKRFYLAKKEVDKINRMNATRILKEKEMIKMQNKMREIIEKNERLVIVPRRKVKEKYKIEVIDVDKQKEDVKKEGCCYLEAIQQCQNLLLE